jgi:hypothetical protein
MTEVRAGLRAAGLRLAFVLRVRVRDRFRRGGEVFFATYTSMITGRITGLRSVTS